MNVLLVYATNSGTTQTVAQIVADMLTDAGHTVTVQEARMSNPEDFVSPQTVILGSPSWDFDGNEGFPHEDFLALMDKMKGSTVAKPFAVFGLGDSSYKFYNGAVDHLEEFVKNIQGTLIIPSLKIDKYYSDVDGNNAIIRAWVDSFNKSLESVV